jgi:hypothetical protein
VRFTGAGGCRTLRSALVGELLDWRKRGRSRTEEAETKKGSGDEEQDKEASKCAADDRRDGFCGETAAVVGCSRLQGRRGRQRRRPRGHDDEEKQKERRGVRNVGEAKRRLRLG